MLSSNSSMLSTISSFDDHQWVIQIRRTLDQELEEDTEIPVSIFSVPKTLQACDPDAYTPQQVPIGPYHYWRPEMYEMERYKLAAAKRMQQHLENQKFEDVALHLRKYEPKIRACYHKYLTCSGESLAWMMAIDACFMLEFLQIYAVKDGKVLERISSRMSHLVDVTGRKSAHNAIIKDMVMLENQIPLFILRKMLETKFSSLEMADNMLFQMLMGFFQVISPFKNMEELSQDQAMECAHLLDVLYHMIVPKLDDQKRSTPRQTTESSQERSAKKPESAEESSEGKEGDDQGRCSWGKTYVKQLLDEVWKILKKLSEGPIRVVQKILSSKIVLFLKQLPWTIISNFPGIKLLKGPLESMCFSKGKEDEKAENEDSTNDDKPPLVEEITIPSVSDLSKASVNFLPTDEGISSIKFDNTTCTFYLPSISLDENTSVVLKNLVAYEACNASGPVIFTRYTELMNGIIDTEEDAKILREKGIIVNRLKSDEDVANIWNSMNRAVRLTKVPFIDKVIGDVNKFYSERWKVKLRKFMKSYVFGSWQILTLLACVMLLLLMTLQAFCNIYSCERLFPIELPPIEAPKG